jgi:hypothetical protein
MSSAILKFTTLSVCVNDTAMSPTFAASRQCDGGRTAIDQRQLDECRVIHLKHSKDVDRLLWETKTAMRSASKGPQQDASDDKR